MGLELFDAQAYLVGPRAVGAPGRTYDISPDGQRFLMVKESRSEQAAAQREIVVVQNWREELKRLVPTK